MRQFSDILDGLGAFSAAETERVKELVRVGEWAIALENLCSQLYEYEVPVSPQVLASIERVGVETGVERQYWTRLLVADRSDAG